MDSEHLANYLEKILIQSCMNESKENFKVSNIFREESMLAIATEKDGAAGQPHERINCKQNIKIN